MGLHKLRNAYESLSFCTYRKKGFQGSGEFNFLKSAGRLAGSPEGSLFGLKWRKTRTRMQIVIILEGPAGRPGRVAEPAVGQLAGGPKGPLFDQKVGNAVHVCKMCSFRRFRLPPPAAEGQNLFLLYVQKSDSYGN